MVLFEPQLEIAVGLQVKGFEAGRCNFPRGALLPGRYGRAFADHGD